MKALVIGIFAIIAIGIMFFAWQLVRQSDFTAITQVSDISTNQKQTYVDINRNSSFDLPKNWIMHDPALVPGFAPIFKSIESDVVTRQSDMVQDIQDSNPNPVSQLQGGFMALGIESLRKNKNIDEDIEIYSLDLPIVNAIKSITGETIELNSDEVKRVTFKSGLNGFIVKYSGNGENYTVEGAVYFYYTVSGIDIAFSTYVEGLSSLTGSSDEGKNENTKISNKQYFLSQAHESFTNMVKY